MKTTLCALLCLLLSLPLTGITEPAASLYEVTGFQPMKISIAVENGLITSFEVIEHNETPGFGADVIDKGFDALIGQEIATATFDAVSGATMTSRAINSALGQASENVKKTSDSSIISKSEISAPETEESTLFIFKNGITFGMTPQEVLSAEDEEPLINTEDMIVYADHKAAGKNATLGYLFTNGELNSIVISFNESHSNNNLFIEDFDDVDESLTAKYGENTLFKRNMIWNDDLFKDSESDYGLAVSCGDLVISSIWFLDGCTISHALTGDNYSINHGLMYSSDEGISASSAPNTDGI